jgi:Uma2 family endonuclease
VNELNKHFARKLSVMVDSRLIWYKHYFEFCDEIIENMEDPPYWIIELATTKFIQDALIVINEYAFDTEPFEEIPSDLCDFSLLVYFLDITGEKYPGLHF